MKIDILRVRAYPFTAEVDEFVREHEQLYVVEMNRDGQLHQLLSLANPEAATRLISVAYGDGLPASAKWIREGILAKSTAGKPVQKSVVKKSTAKKPSVKKNARKGAK